MARPRLAVLISGHGRNLQALIDAVRDRRIIADLAGVLSNRADAPGIQRAKDAGIPVSVLPHADFASRAEFDSALGASLRSLEPDIIALAGFMRVLGEAFVREFEGRLLNVHPSLLPRHKGLDTHARAVADRDAEHGATVHFVTPQLDGGPHVIQGRFIVHPHDDVDSLAERTMTEVETRIYPQAVSWMARGELKLASGRVWFRGEPLAESLGLNDLEPEFR